MSKKNISIEEEWITKAKLKGKTIVLPEGNCDRIIKSAILCDENKLCNIVLLTDDEKKLSKYNLNNYKSIKVVNYITSELRPILASGLFVKRQAKGVTQKEAEELIKNPIYFATMMVELGLVDGSVSGAIVSTKDTFKPALQIIKAKKSGDMISSFFIMLKNDQIYLLSDCGMNVNPSAEEIATFTIQSASSYRQFVGKNPKVALLSFSTFGSADGESAEKMRKAKDLLSKANVDFIYDGEMQLDSAIDKNVAKLKCPMSKVQGDANVLMFPNLDSGNIGYKIMQRFGEFKAIGPIAQGFRLPINDVSRGATVEEIYSTIAITILQTD